MSPGSPLNSEQFMAPDQSNPAYRDASGGIVNPTYRLLPAGTDLYRFGHTVDRRNSNTIARSVNHSSAWWFGREFFQQFVVAANRPASRAGFVISVEDARQGPAPGFDAYGFNALVRARLAVVHLFGQADRVIKAQLLRPLGCFEGIGKPIFEDPATGQLRPLLTDGVMTWNADPTMKQFFIPGLRANGTQQRSAVSEQAMRIITDCPAHQFFTM